MIKRLIIIFLVLFTSFYSIAQVGIGGGRINYAQPKEYELGGVTVSGTQTLDQQAIVLLSGLTVGETIVIPGEDIASAIKKLWDQNLFSDVEIQATKTIGNTIFLNIEVVERSRLSAFRFTGISKSEADKLREKINLYREKIVTDNLIINTQNIIRTFFVDKGFFNVDVDVELKDDPIAPNRVILNINVDKNKRVRIENIIVHGNEALSDGQIKRAMKETKEKTQFQPLRDFDRFLFGSIKRIATFRVEELADSTAQFFTNRLNLNIFKTSKFIEENFEEDKQLIIQKYNQKGYRDARIVSDRVYETQPGMINLELTVDEGSRYHFGDIKWVGNSKYSDQELSAVLAIEKGDVYDQRRLEMQLFMNPNDRDVSSLYMDEGYLFFQVTPVESLIENDTIHLEMRIYEGDPARINQITVVGNVKTNDHVIRREIRTRPGQLFSRADIIRTQRELSQLGLFDAEKLNVTPKPNPAEGTVDVEYVVEERAGDQIELSGGFGGGMVIGTLGVSFNNFSMRNIFNGKAWRPLPAGDGQRLSLRAQSSGLFFQSYNLSFTEPWLGGKKPNALSFNAYHTVSTNGQRMFRENDLGERVENDARSHMKITGVSVGLGKRLRWPDDYFQLHQEVTFQNYDLRNWGRFIFPDGSANNIYYRLALARNSIDQPIYPRMGSKIQLSVQATPPYSLFDGVDDYQALDPQQRYNFVEYHKWKFTSQWFTNIVDKLVLNTKVGFGFLGLYNQGLGAAPFERFTLGGSGFMGINSILLDGREVIALRGYDDNSVSPRMGGTIISRYTMELRYPLSLNPSATIFGLAFAEAGNTWNQFQDFNPFNVKRSAGVGVRLFLPMFGLLGLDWGYRFDDIPAFPNMQRSQIHFTIGMDLGEL